MSLVSIDVSHYQRRSRKEDIEEERDRALFGDFPLRASVVVSRDVMKKMGLTNGAKRHLACFHSNLLVQIWS